MSAFEGVVAGIVVATVIVVGVFALVMVVWAALDGDIDGAYDGSGYRERANDKYTGFRQWVYEFAYQRSARAEQIARARRRLREEQRRGEGGES